MEALTAKAALAGSAAFDFEGTAVGTRIPRSEVESALGADDGPMDLYLDVVRTGEQPEKAHRITVSWERDDLERMLQSSTGDHVTLVFRPDELERIIEQSDVEAHGLRERAAALTVAAATAAGISAGAASAMHAPSQAEAVGTVPAFVTDTTSGGGTAAATEQVRLITDTTSSGPVEAAEESGGTQFVTDTTSGGPVEAAEESGGTQFVTDTTTGGMQAPTEEAATGGSSRFVTDARGGDYTAPTEVTVAAGSGDFLSTASGQAALAGGVALFIAAAGFLATRQRRRVQPT
jgi:hypothetical protein